MAEVLRIQHFERNPQPFFQHFTRCRTQVTGTLLGELSTNYTDSVPSSSFIGSLAFAHNGDLFTVGFDIVSEIGSILKYDGLTQERSLLADASPELQRPIGILYAAQPVPEPLTLGGLAIAASGLIFFRRRR